MVAVIGKTLGSYEIREKIGEGATSEVYRALDTRVDHEVALKVFADRVVKEPGGLERIQQVSRYLAAVDHPYLAGIRSVEESHGVHFITMELLKGWSLRSLITENGLSATTFFEIAIPLVDAVGAAHDAGIVHGSLRPDCVFMTHDGVVKLLGFGSATALPATAAERAPDQPSGPSSDIRALGAVFYEMVTGRAPSAVPASIGEARRDLPRSLATLIERCLDPVPGRRPPSAHALRRELTEIRREMETGGERRVPWIVVLPLVDASLEKDQDYFCEGITDEIRKRLAGLPNVHIVSRISTLQFRDSELSAQEIGRRLNATAVVQGTITKSGKNLGMTVELLDVAGGRPLWSGEYDRKSKDIFALQGQIVRSVEAALIPGEARPSPTPATTDILAYEFYLRGRKFYYQFRRKGVELALQMFSTAIKHDPAYALAHASIADCWCFLYLYAERRKESLEQAEAASGKALELGPELAATHASRGLVLSLSGKESETEFQTAIRLDPALFEAYYYYARDCFARGKLEQSAGLFERAIDANPDDYQSPLLIAQVYQDLERPADAEAARRRGVRIVEDQLRVHPGDVRALYMGANGLAALGETQRALEWANLALVVEPREPMVLYNVGCVLTRCGKHEEAIDCLEKAARGGLAQKGWYEHDGDLHPLRGHVRFKALMAWLEENRSD